MYKTSQLKNSTRTQSNGNSKDLCFSLPFDFDAEISKIQGQLFSFIMSAVFNKEDAKDILQDTNLILCKKQREFDPNLGELKHWAFAICRYQIMAFRTKKGRSKLTFSNELIDSILEEQEEFLEEYEINKKALDICYTQLPTHMIDICKLWFKECKSVKEISKNVGRSMGAVSSTLHRLRVHLLKCTQSKINNYKVYGRFENE